MRKRLMLNDFTFLIPPLGVFGEEKLYYAQNVISCEHRCNTHNPQGDGSFFGLIIQFLFDLDDVRQYFIFLFVVIYGYQML